MTAPTREFTWITTTCSAPASPFGAPIKRPRYNEYEYWNGNPASQWTRWLIWSWKQVLIAHGWSVAGSCGYDGATFTAAMDGVDRWTSADAVTGKWGSLTGAFSWIVLRNTAMSSEGGGYQILISPEMYDANYNYPIYICESYGGAYTGGGVNARPTASDEVVLLVSSGTTGNTELSTVSNEPRGVTVFSSSDGLRTRSIFSSAKGTVILMVVFERAQGAAAWWDKPVISGVCQPTYAALNTPSAANVRMFVHVGDTIGVPAYLSADGLGTAGVLGTQVLLGGADPNGNWLCSPVGVIGSCARSVGYMGRLADAYWVHQNMANGDYYPNDASRQWVIIGDLMHAAGGGVVVLD